MSRSSTSLLPITALPNVGREGRGVVAVLLAETAPDVVVGEGDLPVVVHFGGRGRGQGLDSGGAGAGAGDDEVVRGCA